MKKPNSLEELSIEREQINKERDLEAKVALLPRIPKQLSFDSKEIAAHIARDPANSDEFGQSIIGPDGKLTPDAHDYFLDEVVNESEVVAEYECSGSGGEFPACVMEWRGIFWVQAPEFDDIGYFLSMEEAVFHAEEIAEAYPA